MPLSDLQMAVAHFDSNGDIRLDRAEWARWIDQGALIQKKSINTVAMNAQAFLKKPVILDAESDRMFVEIDTDKSNNLNATELAKAFSSP